MCERGFWILWQSDYCFCCGPETELRLDRRGLGRSFHLYLLPFMIAMPCPNLRNTTGIIIHSFMRNVLLTSFLTQLFPSLLFSMSPSGFIFPFTMMQCRAHCRAQMCPGAPDASLLARSFLATINPERTGRERENKWHCSIKLLRVAHMLGARE